jgi:hypothetical protein
VIAAAKDATQSDAHCSLIVGVGDALAIDPAIGAWLQAGGDSVLPKPSLDLAAATLSLTDLRLAASTGALGSLADAGPPIALANVFVGGADQDLFPGSISVECLDHRIVLIGVTDEGDVPGLQVDDPARAVQRLLDRESDGSEITILLSGAGLDADRRMAALRDEIDVIVGVGQPPRDAVDTVEGTHTIVLRAGPPGRSLGVARLELGPDGSIVRQTWTRSVFHSP